MSKKDLSEEVVIILNEMFKDDILAKCPIQLPLPFKN